jgi:hypothetical protein
MWKLSVPMGRPSLRTLLSLPTTAIGTKLNYLYLN